MLGMALGMLQGMDHAQRGGDLQTPHRLGLQVMIELFDQVAEPVDHAGGP